MELDVAAHLSDLDGVLPSLTEFALPATLNPLSCHDALADELEDLSASAFSNIPLNFPVVTPDESVDSGTLAVAPTGGTVVPAVRTLRKRVAGNVSHTRRCRAKVNAKLGELLALLPEAALAAGGARADGVPDGSGGEVKHKAQILALAVERFSALRARNVELEMQLAMSTPYHMRRWVRSVSDMAPDLARALKPFMTMICLTRSWKYAELWEPATGGSGTLLKYRTSSLPLQLPGDERDRLRGYRARSRKFAFMPRSGVPGRVFLTRRPEWLPALDDAVAFPRAPYAVEHRLEVTFAVPVIVHGEVRMVVEFYDTTKRGYDPAIVNIANAIAAMFGAAFEERQPRSFPFVSEIL